MIDIGDKQLFAVKGIRFGNTDGYSAEQENIDMV
jgi:hypothetical protein